MKVVIDQWEPSQILSGQTITWCITNAVSVPPFISIIIFHYFYIDRSLPISRSYTDIQDLCHNLDATYAEIFNLGYYIFWHTISCAELSTFSILVGQPLIRSLTKFLCH